MGSLCTDAQIKRALGIPAAVTMHDDYLDHLSYVADKQCLAYCGVASLTSTVITDEAYDVSNASTNEFTLRNFPVSSVTAVKSGGTTLSTDAWYVEERSGTIRLINAGSFFDEGRQEIKVSYTAGFSTITADLQSAATLCAVAHFSRGRHSGMSNEGMGSYRYSIDRDAMPQSARALLSSYRRIFPKEAQPT